MYVSQWNSGIQISSDLFTLDPMNPLNGLILLGLDYITDIHSGIAVGQRTLSKYLLLVVDILTAGHKKSLLLIFYRQHL